MSEIFDSATMRADRAKIRGAREARFDIRQGSTITAKDARENIRFSSGTRADYWRGYANEMVKQGRR